MTLPADKFPQLSVGQRFRGAILGAAVGNALGVTTEMQPARPQPEWVTTLTGGGWRQWPAGKWAEETDLLLLTAGSLLERKVFDPEDIASRMADWAHNRAVNVSPAVLQVLSLIQQGEPCMTAAADVMESSGTQDGNDGLPLCIPLALFFYKTPVYIGTLAPVLSSITLPSEPCKEAASIFTALLAYIASGLSTETAINQALGSQEVESTVGAAIETTAMPEAPPPPKATAIATLRTAVWALRWHGGFLDTVAAAANMGEDAGCAATLAGALAGALYGDVNIPSDMLETLSDRSHLIAVADALLALAFV